MKIVKNEDGQVLVLTALLLAVLLGFAALTIDIGMVYITKTKLQNAADAAALAGAQDLPNTSSDTITGNLTAESTAIYYAEQNGVQESETKPTPSYNGDSTKIEVICTKTISYTFARVLGFTQADVSARAIAQKITVGGEAFGFAVFAGEGEASFNGTAHVFDGGVYGRDGVTLGNGAEILHGDAVSSYGTTDSFIGPGESITNNPVIPLPDLSELIKSQGIIVNNQAEFDAAVNGKSVNGPIYVNGDLTINGRIQGSGIIYASGTITFNGDNILQKSEDSICFYAETGDITFNGGSDIVVGILYAPHGTIRVNGGPNSTTYGRIIAKSIDVNGAKASVYTGANDLKAFNTLKIVKTVKLVQ